MLSVLVLVECKISVDLFFKFGKIIDGNLKSGNIIDVDRVKVIKIVVICVWVYIDFLFLGCCKWLVKRLILKYFMWVV